MARRRRSYPVKASQSPEGANGSDVGKYYRCWNCGFICDVDRDSQGGPNDRSGDSSEFYYQYYPQSFGDDHSKTTDYELSLEGQMVDDSLSLPRLAVMRGRTIGMQLGLDGMEKPVRLTYLSKVTAGCPFCGCRSWKG